MNKGQPLQQESLLYVPAIFQRGDNGATPEITRSLYSAEGKSSAGGDYPQLEVFRICLGQALSSPV